MDEIAPSIKELHYTMRVVVLDVLDKEQLRQKLQAILNAHGFHTLIEHALLPNPLENKMEKH